MRRSRLIAALFGLIVGLVLVPAVVSGQEEPTPRATTEVATFETITPCRIVDTRLSTRMAAGETRGFVVTGTAGFPAQGGEAGGCGIPASASAVEFSVTSVEPVGKGYLRMWAATDPAPTATVLNYDTTLNATNSVGVGVSPGAEHLKVKVFQEATDVVIDVSGYYEDNDQVAALRADVAALQADLAALHADVATKADATDVAANTTAIATNATDIGKVQTLMAGVSRAKDANGNDTLTFEGMNLQVTNGTDTTDGEPNGLGNVVVGYNKDSGSFDRSGSHYLVVGDQHTYTAYGGAVFGWGNTASGTFATVTGGSGNTASGDYSSVAGGWRNTASSSRASVSGGSQNTASRMMASVTGGAGNTASGDYSSVTGGSSNIASGLAASVSGGIRNTAGGLNSSATGGSTNEASGDRASVTGGEGNEAIGDYASVGGGWANDATNLHATVAGGQENIASGTESTVSGGALNEASGNNSLVSGGVDCTESRTNGWSVGARPDGVGCTIIN